MNDKMKGDIAAILQRGMAEGATVQEMVDAIVPLVDHAAAQDVAREESRRVFSFRTSRLLRERIGALPDVVSVGVDESDAPKFGVIRVHVSMRREPAEADYATFKAIADDAREGGVTVSFAAEVSDG